MKPRPTTHTPAVHSPILRAGLALAFSLALALPAQLEHPTAAAPAIAAADSPAGETAAALSSANLPASNFTVDSGTRTEESRAFTSDRDGVSAILVAGSGDLTLATPRIATTGNATPDDDRTGAHNSAMLACAGGRISVTGGSITTSGRHAAGVFASDRGSTIALSNLRIDTTGSGSRGGAAGSGGALALHNVDIRTTGAHSPALAIERDGGSIAATGGTFGTEGTDAPALHAQGAIALAGASLKSADSAAAVIEGSGSIELKDCTLAGQKICGALIFRDANTETRGRHGAFTMEGGTFSALDGPLFLVTNTRSTIRLTGVTLEAPSGILVDAIADRRGRKDRNGGHVALFATRQILIGDMRCDGSSSVSATLRQNSMLVGALDHVALALDASSTWEVRGDSALTGLTIAPGTVSKGTISCIVGNGHTIGYDAGDPLNRWLGSTTYALAGGGQLVPIERPLFRK